MDKKLLLYKLECIEELLTEHLVDSGVKYFEDLPEVDEARTLAQELQELINNSLTRAEKLLYFKEKYNK